MDRGNGEKFPRRPRLQFGSLAVRVGDELYDGTVRRQLDAAREVLAG